MNLIAALIFIFGSHAHAASTTQRIVPSAPLTLSGATLSIPRATAGVNGYLHQSDFSTFNGAATATSAATASNTAGAIVKRDGSGNFSAGTVTAALSGNATTATALASNPTDCSAGQYANAIAANGNLTCADPFSGMVEEINGQVETVSDKSYILVPKARYASTVAKIYASCSSGTTSVALKIDGTNVTSCSAISVSSTPADTTCTAANTLSSGSQLTLVTSSTSSCTDFSFTIQRTRN